MIKSVKCRNLSDVDVGENGRAQKVGRVAGASGAHVMSVSPTVSANGPSRSRATNTNFHILHQAALMAAAQR